MDYVTQYYKNLSEQLQQRVNFLNKKVKYLTEAEATPGPTDGGKGGQSPFGPGGYFYPSQLNPPQFTPNPNPTPKPYPGRTPIKPGHYMPQPPPNGEEWLRDNPPPNPDNYPGGVDDEQFLEDAREWLRIREEWYREWGRWRKRLRSDQPPRFTNDPLPPNYGPWPPFPANWPKFLKDIYKADQ